MSMGGIPGGVGPTEELAPDPPAPVASGRAWRGVAAGLVGRRSSWWAGPRLGMACLVELSPGERGDGKVLH